VLEFGQREHLPRRIDQVEEIVLRRKEHARVVARAEVQLRLDVRVVRARHVVGHEVDDHLHPRVVDALDQRGKFAQPLRRIQRVIGAHVEVVFDRVEAAGLALEHVGVVGRLR